MDKKTIAYFDSYTPQYGAANRYKYVAELIRNLYRPGCSCIDIGCGSGECLQFIKDNTPVEKLVGLDVSNNYLKQTRKRVGCKTHLGSILLVDSITDIHNNFDFVIMGSILHHLIGRTRKESKDYAELAINNALKLLKIGGYLFVYEPSIYPSFVALIAFYLKKTVTSITSRRVELFSRNFNLGEPVTSFYTIGQLLEMISKIKETKLVDKKVVVRHSFGISMRKTGTIFVLQRVL